MSRRKSVGVLVGLVAMLLAPSNAFAHAVVFPKTSEPGAYEKYTLRVPNERDVATTRVEIRFPRSVRVVSFADVPGWALQVLTDSAKHVMGAAWTGSLAPQRFIEFPFVAVNPENPVKLVWPVFQTYASGERVDWTGHDDAKTPASATVIRGAAQAGPQIVIALSLCILAVILSLISLALTIRADGREGGFQPAG